MVLTDLICTMQNEMKTHFSGRNTRTYSTLRQSTHSISIKCDAIIYVARQTNFMIAKIIHTIFLQYFVVFFFFNFNVSRFDGTTSSFVRTTDTHAHKHTKTWTWSHSYTRHRKHKFICVHITQWATETVSGIMWHRWELCHPQVRQKLTISTSDKKEMTDANGCRSK